MDRHTIQAVQRAVKQKARKVKRPVPQDGEVIVYCCRCLKGSYEVEGMIYDPFISLCYECVDNLGIFVGHLREQKQNHTQAQSEPNEGESSQDRQGTRDEGY